MLRLKGGMKVDIDGRIRTSFGHNPSTLRLSSSNPNLQQIPRGGTEAQRWVKDIFEAPPGYVFLEADYSGLEAVLVGYFANAPRYVRAAKLGVHAFLVGYMVGEPVSWELTDAEIKPLLRGLKERFKDDLYPPAKTTVHGSNYLMTPHLMHTNRYDLFPTVAKARELQEMYFGIFPEIPAWHKDLCERVDGTKKWRLAKDEPPDDITPWTLGTATVQNPFGYLHRFYNVLEWHKAEGEWFSNFGPDAKRLIANLPQSTGSGIVKQAASTLYYGYPEIGRMLRLLIHDSLFLEVPESAALEIAKTVKDVMTAPIPQLPLDPLWQMGTHLTIGVEIKMGKTWSQMKEIHV